MHLRYIKLMYIKYRMCYTCPSVEAEVVLSSIGFQKKKNRCHIGRKVLVYISINFMQRSYFCLDAA